MRQIFLIISCIFLASVCSASKLRGKVFDSATHEELPGVTVYVNELQAGDVSELDGDYKIKDIPKGEYTVTVSFLSYTTITRHIKFSSDTETISLNFYMATESKALSEVTIISAITGSQDAGARELEKRSDNIVNILSGKTIQLMPDVTVGSVLRRVSGVTVDRGTDGEAQYPVIRGMNRRYNYTLVNGIKIPSPDDKARYVPMDIFPSEMLQRLEVIKTLTPDMEADATGGVMNLIMKDAPDRFMLDAQAAMGYSQYAFGQSFMGYPAGSPQLKSPAELYGSNYNALYSDFSKANLNYNKGAALPDGQLGFTIGDRLVHRKLGVILSGSYQTSDRITKDIFNNPSPQPTATTVGNQPAFGDVQSRTYYTHSDRLGINTKLDYQFDDKNKISFYGLLMQLNTYQVRNIQDTALPRSNAQGAYSVSSDTRSKTTLQDIYSGTLQGEHNPFKNFRIQWSAVYSLASEQQPDVAEIDLQQNVPNGPYIPSGLPIYWQHNSDQNGAGYLNFHYAFNIGSQSFDFGVGGMYRHKYRENYFNDYTELYAVGNPVPPFTNINSTQFAFVGGVNGAQGSQLGDPDIYDVTENISAEYAELRWEYKNWSVLGGYRIENTSLSYVQPTVPATSVGKTGDVTYNDPFPSADIKYKLNEKSAIHVSFYSSITRPDFFEIVPYVFPGEYYTEVGNYNLVPSLANNIDLRYELFPGKADQLLVGVFYKDIQDPIQYVLQRYVISDQEIQPVNDTLSDAINYGLELVYTKFIHRFGISLNYTYTHSSVTNSEAIAYATGNASNPESKKYVNVTSPLQGQASNIGNASLLYKDDRKKKGLELQLSAVYTGKFIADVSPYYGLEQWELGSLILDFSGQKKLGKHFSLYAKINNLLNTPKTIVIEQNGSYLTGSMHLLDQTSSSVIVVEKEYFGQTYLLGVRYNL